MIPIGFFSSIAKCSLTPTEYKCILILLEHEDCMQTYIADELEISRQNINRAITKLEKIGIIKRNRIEGRNIFFKVNLDFRTSIDFDKNQLTL